MLRSTSTTRPLLKRQHKGGTVKITEQKNGAWTVYERIMPAGLYLVKLYRPSGELEDKIICYERAPALEYLRAFNKIAKGMQ